MKIYVLVDTEGNIQGWGSTRSMDSEVEIEITDNHEFLYGNPRMYVYQNGEIIKNDSKIFQEIKDKKIEKLNRMCNETILGRFSFDINGESFLFSNDLEAQSNFDKCDRAFEKGFMTTIAWTAYNSAGEVVRLDFTAENFPPLYMAHLNHIQGNISRFRDELMPLVEQATTVEEVENINW